MTRVIIGGLGFWGYTISAYRLIPVHPKDRRLQAVQWENQFYIDPMLPFGLRSVPKIFNAIADALHWYLQSSGIQLLFHYLDDFIIAGPPHSPQCAESLAILDRECTYLNVPMAGHKREGPCHMPNHSGHCHRYHCGSVTTSSRQTRTIAVTPAAVGPQESLYSQGPGITNRPTKSRLQSSEIREVISTVHARPTTRCCGEREIGKESYGNTRTESSKATKKMF